MTNNWTIPELNLPEGATDAQARDMIFALAPQWLVERGAVWISEKQVDVFTGAGVIPAFTGDTIELVEDETYGMVCKVTTAATTIH